MAKSTHVGTITALERIKMGRGPVQRSSGCGAFRNRKFDKKLRRREDRRACND